MFRMKRLAHRGRIRPILSAYGFLRSLGFTGDSVQVFAFCHSSVVAHSSSLRLTSRSAVALDSLDLTPDAMFADHDS